MQTTIKCKNGGHEVPANFRLKGNQQYCGDSECQRARKRAWQKNKMATDIKYRRKQIACLVRWRKEHLLHRYQKQYRDEHPEYVEKNREKQRLRNDKRRQRVQPDQIEMIVKMDALLVELKTFHDDSPIQLANTC